jgi:heat shock protein HslJ
VLALALLLTMAVAGCAAGRPGPGQPDVRPPSLVGRTFVATSVTEDGEPRPPVEGTEIEVSFPEQGRIGASADCNSMGGTVEVQRRQLVVGALAMTRMSCGPERDEQDRWLAGFLEADPAFRLGADTLHLQVGGTAIELVERDAPQPGVPLEGTEWSLEEIIVGGDAIYLLPPGTGATITFRDGGVGAQVLNCNVGSGDAAVRGSEITIGRMGWTLRACEEEPAQVEAAVAGVLQGTITYSIQGNTLTLRQPGTGNGLVLRAPLVAYHVTGGFVGIDERLVVRASGEAVLISDRGPSGTRTLSDEELAELNEVLEASDFANIPADTIDPNVADAFIYEVTYQGRTVVTSDGYLTPPELQTIIGQLRQIVAGFGET